MKRLNLKSIQKRFLFSTFLLFSLLSMCMLLNSCKDPVEPEEPDTFEIESSSLNIDVEAAKGSERIPVKTNLDWSKEVAMESDQPWCVVTTDYQDKNTILLLFEASEEVEVRSANITIKTHVGNYVIKLRQLGLGPKILVNPQTLDVGMNGESIGIKIKANVEYSISKSADSDWLVNATAPDTRGMVESNHYWNVEKNNLYESRTAKIFFIGANNSTKDSCVIVQAGQIGSPGEVDIPGDIKATPSSGYASEAQPGQGIERSFDGKFASDGAAPYHSIWSQSANFPVTLEYFFDSKPDLDYLIYHTRSGNGNFGKLKIYTATEDSPDYKLLGDYNFNMQSAPSRVLFPERLERVTKIKFMVESGLGDFVSCDEMEFYRYNTESPLNSVLLSVFTDLTCSQLKDGVTDEAIYQMPGYFIQLAHKLKNGGYDEHEANFRIREYNPYSNVEEWADILMTNRYSPLDNCTGITATANDTILVLVGETHGNQISLQCIRETEVSGDNYILNEGINKLVMKASGQLFLMYTAHPSSPPIKVHIPYNNGVVNGFFDVDEHKTDAKYAELLQKSHYKYFFIRSPRVTFYFHRSALLDVVPDQILSAINLWDELVGWQQELMGIDDVRPKDVNNTLMAISTEDGYMWASQYRMGFIHTYLHNILLRDNVMAVADNAWGPAHEMGHMHQQAINWPSSTESSNNLFSNYTIYRLGKYGSRGSEMKRLAEARFIQKSAWALMEFESGGEDTELHMRKNWQLWNYFHRCGYKTDFWQQVFKEMRESENRINNGDPGEAQMTFAKVVAKVANMDMTPFFEMWGYFEPVNTVVSQYGDYQYTVTEQMISETKAYLAQFPPMAHAIQYIEDRKMTNFDIGNYQVGDVGHFSQYEDGGMKITKSPTYSLSGRTISIKDGEEAVAFEIHKDGKIIYFFNFLTFDIPQSISLENVEIYAVQADGVRVSINRL